MNEVPIKLVVERWIRRYSGRRFVMGIDVGRAIPGSAVRQYIEFDITLRRALHALRNAWAPSFRRLMWRLSR